MSTQQKRQFTEEFKRDTVALIQREQSTLKEAAQRLGIHPSLLSKWKCRLARETEGEQGRLGSTAESLAEENRRLKAENRRLQLE